MAAAFVMALTALTLAVAADLALRATYWDRWQKKWNAAAHDAWKALHEWQRSR